MTSAWLLSLFVACLMACSLAISYWRSRENPMTASTQASGQWARWRGSPGRLVIILLGVMLVIGSAGVVAAPLTADSHPAGELTADERAADNLTTIEHSPDFEIQSLSGDLATGEEVSLTLLVTNDAATLDDSYPAAVRENSTVARDLTVEIDNTGDLLIAVLTDSQNVGDLAAGESVEVTFDVAIPDDAEVGEHEIEIGLEYEHVAELTYDPDDGTTVEENVTTERDTIDVTITLYSPPPSLTTILFWLLPILIPMVVIATWLGGKADPRIEGAIDRLSRVIFGRFVRPNTEKRRRIEAAYIGTTYRTYAAKTWLFVLIGLVAGAIAGAYLIAGILLILEPLVRTLAGLPRTITHPLGITHDFTFEIATRTRWIVLLSGGLLLGVLTGTLAYVFRWQLPASDAAVRRRGIDAGMARTTAFMYALSRGGMEFPQIVRILSDHREVYGEPANEMSITVREMDLFGRDMISALRRMSRRTPSEQFKTFSENLTSVLQSGSDLSEFFKEQYERFHREAEERQEDVLELLATIAEAYVTIFVAGMLFFITILLVFGLTVTDTLWLLQLIIYLMIPLANAGFAVFLQQQLDSLGIGQEGGTEILDEMEAATPVNSTPTSRQRQPDGGYSHSREAENRRILAYHDKVERVKKAMQNPIQLVIWNPEKIFWVVIPIALVLFAVRAPGAFQAEGVSIRILDDLIIQSVLLVLFSYAIVRYLYKRRIQQIEEATPEMLERLASLNEAGMSVVQGLDRVRGSDMGVLTPEVERIWRDIEFGANVDDAMVRFGRRVRTTAITRVVTLLTNAMRASGDMGPVLRIASEQARAELKLRRQRQQQMLTYLVVIYVSFFVFLVIILAVNEVLVPSLPDSAPMPEGRDADRLGASPESIARFGEVDQAAYTLIFFHAALIQAVCAGFIGGQLGEGSLKDGAKHAAIMLLIAYGTFVILTSPIASIALTTHVTHTDDGEIIYELESDGQTLTGLEEVTLSEGGFIAAYDAEEGINGTLLGHSEYLAPGSHSDVVIHLQEELSADTTVRIVAHHDSNGNQEFDFTPPYQPGTDQVDGPYDKPSEDDEPGIDARVLYVGPN